MRILVIVTAAVILFLYVFPNILVVKCLRVAHKNRLGVGLMKLFEWRLKGLPPLLIIEALAILKEAGIEMKSTIALEDVYLEGGNPVDLAKYLASEKDAGRTPDPAKYCISELTKRNDSGSAE